MSYEVLISEFADVVAEVESFNDPREARHAFEVLRIRFGSNAVSLMRNNCPITEAQLAADVELYKPRTDARRKHKNRRNVFSFLKR